MYSRARQTVAIMTHRRNPLPAARVLEIVPLRWLSALVFGFVAAAAFGQTTPGAQSPAATPDQVPGISTNVNEVSLDLVVHDKRHSAVLDLKPQDLVVTDNGVPVNLTGFHLVRGDAATGRGHLITLLFDPFAGPTAKSARIIAQKIVAVLPKAGYTYAVLDCNSRLRLIQGFTQDANAVQQAVIVETESRPIVMSSSISLDLGTTDDRAAEQGRIKTASIAEKTLIAVALTGVDASGKHVDPKDRTMAETLMTALRDSQSIAQEQHARLALAGLLALVKSQQGIGDRKAIIYFTHNLQLDLASKKMLETISSEATRASVSIYTVDMDSVSSGSSTDEANALLNGQTNSGLPLAQEAGTPIAGQTPITGPHGNNQGAVWGPAQDIQVMTDFMRSSGEDRTNPFNDTKSPMADFSKATGGAYIDAQISTKKPLEQLADDLATYYQASYIPPFKDYDGKFRTIAVKPLRTGLTIQTKTGYFALAAGADAGIQPFEGPLLKSFTEPTLPTDVKFHGAVLRFGDLPDGNTSTVAVEVPLAALQAKVDAQSKLSAAHVSIVAQIKDASGVVIEHYSEDIVKRGVAETLDRDHSATISMERHFITVPGKYSLEVGVLDQNSGKAGAQRTEFEIPGQPGAVSLSDMVLVRKIEGSHVEDDDPLEPMRYEHQKVTPNLTGELPANGHDTSMFFILHPDPDSDQPLTLEMELIHNGKAGKRMPLLHSDGEHAPIPYLASIGSRALPPGEYEVKAFIRQGSKSAEQSSVFTVAAKPGAQSSAADSDLLEGADITADMGDQTSGPPPRPPSQLAIVAPASPQPAPAQDEAQTTIDAARERAVSFSESLPNFVCTEVTKRSVDMNGDGKWKLRDTLVELLSYRERVETHTTLEVNGKASELDRAALKGTFSAGEFGGVLMAVFRASSKADFKWKETDMLNGEAVQVYDYRVDRANSTFSVTGSNGKQMVVGFHGQVFVDSGSRRARRITLTADDLPADFPTHATSIAVDYDYVAIGGLKYLMPVSAELQLSQGRHEALVNTMEFRDYKRFNSDVQNP
jgi:VWFA-related protein